nr:hypothetical protein [uncultured Campylobacter sp.]
MSDCVLCAREATSESGLRRLYLLLQNSAATFGAALSSCSKAARTKRSLTSERYGPAKLARKTVVEILFQKVFLKFYFTKF